MEFGIRDTQPVLPPPHPQCDLKGYGISQISQKGGELMPEKKKQTKLAKWGEMSTGMSVFTHSEVGTEQKVIKLKLKIGTDSITGVR